MSVLSVLRISRRYGLFKWHPAAELTTPSRHVRYAAFKPRYVGIRPCVSAHLICLFCFALTLAFPPASHAAGVTIITHGYECGGGLPSWITEMANAIVARSGGPQNVALYNLVVGPDTSGNPAITSFSPAPGYADPLSSDNAEIIIAVDWSAFSGGIQPGCLFFHGNGDVATAVANALTSATIPLASLTTVPSPTDRPLAELPIHLIGHSRGGSLVCEIARLLGQQGIWVDQVTTLDPHRICIDAPANIYANVLYADNYYQTIDGRPGCAEVNPCGFSVQGAYNRQLTDLDGGWTGLGGIHLPGDVHNNVHLWYHGTVDTGVAASDGTAAITTAMRDTWWYPDSENQGATAGFYYSLLGGGYRLGGIPEDGNEAVGNGYNFGFNRVQLNVQGIWPNIVTLSANPGTPVVIGDAMTVQYTYEDDTDQPTITFYLDPDQNPYDGNEVFPGSYLLSVTSYGTSKLPTQTLQMDTTGAPAGTYYLYAKISGENGTRYLYAPGQITLIPPNTGGGTTLLPAPNLLSPVNGSGGQSTTPTFSWSPISGASSYRIMVATSLAALPSDPTVPTCSECVLDNTTTLTSYPLDSVILNPGTTYYWQVHARSPAYFGTWSSPSSFTTASAITWTGAVSSDWFNPTNWNPMTVPGAGELS